MTTTNCNIKYDKEYDVYCGRGQGKFWNPLQCTPGVDEGWLGNPIVPNQVCIMCGETHENGGGTLRCYEYYLSERLKNNILFKTEFYKLKGKKLGCFCKPNACHTDIIIKFLDGETEERKESTLF